MRRSLFLAFALFASLVATLGVAGCSEVLPALEDGEERRNNGDRCLQDWECASQHCECEDFDCDRRFCTPDDCLCGYGTSGSCDEPLVGREDPEDCDGLNAECAGIGECQNR